MSSTNNIVTNDSRNAKANKRRIIGFVIAFLTLSLYTIAKPDKPAKPEKSKKSHVACHIP
ncbi:hypothetical protein [Sulfurisphaera ohwakuensis]|uniref:hypothetical protein n=1 Tax=Sulfurisphaera ohwakuensis TaxID=69656 RepID=UPI0036F3696B